MSLEDDRLFEPDKRLTISTKNGERVVEVEFFRRQHGRCVLKLREINSIAEAEKYIGAELRIPIEDLPVLEAGVFYTFQLKGCAVYSDDEFIGDVTDVLDLGGTEILKVDRDGDETLIPFAQSYLRKIDLDRRRIDVDLPDGLRELNK